MPGALLGLQQHASFPAITTGFREQRQEETALVLAAAHSVGGAVRDLSVRRGSALLVSIAA